VAVEDRRQHERLVQELVDPTLVRLDTNHAVLGEAARTIGEQADALEHVLDHNRLEDVQLKVAVAPRDRDRRVVAHDLGRDHRESLALRRVDLARHDRAARLVLRQGELAEPAARTGPEEADVVRDLHERYRKHVEGTVRLDQCVVCCKRLELVRRRLELEASKLRDLGGNLDIEAPLGIQTLNASVNVMS
jgi:hypothetical protein